MTYGAETWTLTKKLVHRLKVAQRAMEKALLGWSQLDRIPNVEIRNRTGITDIVPKAAALKWNWAGHICRREVGWWCRVILDCQLRTGHRNIGRPPARWRDDIVKAIGKNWMQLCRRANEEALVQQWTEIG
ncbi:jg9592 [Pararge aegeria aegeria]|uniref:Jg9592 protein n=1 Tax=Pararge aegeria aegeria TaxID=348720 RepID=A0A8S4S9Y9_9NEOP|nr:jg9592 [Pararge aegeria aegeria]